MKRIVYSTLLLILLSVNQTNLQAQELRPLLEEGKTWTVDNDVAGGGVFHLYSEYNLNESREINGISFWSVSQLQLQSGEILGEAEVVRDYYMGEKDGKLYFWDGSELNAPGMFMDFSLTAGSSLFFENVKYEENSVRLEVATVTDTVFAKSKDTRRCMHVVYCVNDAPGIWSEMERDVWVEGIGSLKYGIMFPYYFGTTGAIQSLWECRFGETILYAAPNNPDGISSPSMVNGPCSMLRDLQGRRLKAEPQHGVFIKDGRKVMR